MNDKKSIVDQGLIRELATLLNETGLTEIEVDRDGTRIRVARSAAPIAVSAPAPAAPPVQPATPAPTGETGSQAGAVLSPMVGTAFLAPEPGGMPYVDVGDRVSEGQTLLIIEAMKTMNQIPSPRAGTVVRIIASDGHPVEFGEPLIIIE